MDLIDQFDAHGRDDEANDKLQELFMKSYETVRCFLSRFIGLSQCL